jgi:hypothetical protein
MNEILSTVLNQSKLEADLLERFVCTSFREGGSCTLSFKHLHVPPSLNGIVLDAFMPS